MDAALESRQASLERRLAAAERAVALVAAWGPTPAAGIDAASLPGPWQALAARQDAILERLDRAFAAFARMTTRDPASPAPPAAKPATLAARVPFRLVYSPAPGAVPLRSLELIAPATDADTTAAVTRVASSLARAGVRECALARVPADYYNRGLEQRAALLSSASPVPSLGAAHLLKSVVFATGAPAGSGLPEHVLAIVQYISRIDVDRLKAAVMGPAHAVGLRKRLNLVLAPPDVALALTGYAHGAVCPAGLASPLPVFVARGAASLRPDWGWLGGGRTDLKLGVSMGELIAALGASVVDCDCGLGIGDGDGEE